MSHATHDVIRGEIHGRERLRVISRIMHPTSSSLLDRLELHEGLVCADFGCGGGDLTVELARRVGPTGKAFGFDIDQRSSTSRAQRPSDSGYQTSSSTRSPSALVVHAQLRLKDSMPTLRLLLVVMLLIESPCDDGGWSPRANRASLDAIVFGVFSAQLRCRWFIRNRGRGMANVQGRLEDRWRSSRARCRRVGQADAMAPASIGCERRIGT